ncbi:hypothetical protein DRN97_02580 [Methanosarcinales archaeon]|nr:MAG: hypothetical protein DRN97_02580 [Methanosarcinales archaeon]
MTSVPLVTLSGDRAVIMANDGPLVTFVDKWNSHGYIASLIEKESEDGSGYVYAIGKVVYDLAKVPLEKVQEIATKIANGEFSCPVCRRLATQADSSNHREVEKHEEAAVEASSVPEEPEKEQPEEPDESEERERARARAVKEIVHMLDDILLMRAVLAK